MANNKALGQHWLKNREILEKIAELAAGRTGRVGNCSADDFPEKEVPLCVEIGPGLGTLTSSLLKRFSKVIAVEYDAKLATNLPESFPGKNLEVVNEDILTFDFTKLKERYVVAGNIPYYITSPIIHKVLDAKPERAVFLIQKEVAERIAGDKETFLSLSVKNRAEVELGPVVPRDEFTPPPQVDSQVIVLTPHAPMVSDKVLKLIKIGFSAPRKKVIRNLASLVPAEDIKTVFVRKNINVDVRPHELLLSDWQLIYDELVKILSK